MIWEQWVTRFQHHHFGRLQSPIGGKMGQLSPIIQPLLPYVKHSSYGQTLKLIASSLLGAVMCLLRYSYCTPLLRSWGHVSIPIVSYVMHTDGIPTLPVLESYWLVGLCLTIRVGTLCWLDVFAASIRCRYHAPVNALESMSNLNMIEVTALLAFSTKTTLSAQSSN